MSTAPMRVKFDPRSLLVRLGLVVTLPVAVYLVTQSIGWAQVPSLILSGAIPVGEVLVRLIWRRRLDPIGMLAVVGFGVSLLISTLLGGDPLVLKLRDAPILGAIGLAGLVSVAVQRPLLSGVLRLFRVRVKIGYRRSMFITSIAGTALVLNAVVRILLAFALPTTVFLSVDHFVSWGILGAGLVALLLTRGREGQQSPDMATKVSRDAGTPGSGRIDVPGASLYYTVRGTGPLLLLLQGGTGDADTAAAFTQALAESFTVVTYDRRGQTRSPITDPDETVSIETHSQDAHLLLDHLTHDPAHVFGSSIGAVIGLELATRHAVQIACLVAHEPPLPQLLPEDQRPKTNPAGFEGRSEEEKVSAFAASIGITRPGMGIGPTPNHSRNSEVFLAQDAPAVARYQLDLGALKHAPTRIVVAAGADGRAFFPYQCAAALANQLGTPLAEFPGDHAGYARQPTAFATQLRSLLEP
jgi:pimeloyl-ACP methyl ester carboxylesterase